MSIFIDGGLRSSRKSLPRVIQENMESLARKHDWMPHRLFHDEEIVQIIDENFSPEVRHAFEGLRPHAYKADLAKYVLLYNFGGVYADLSYLFVNPVPLTDNKLFVFRDLLWSAPWDTSVGVIYSPPRHASMAAAIDMVCRNVRKKYYGATTLCPTGPALFGKALAATSEAEELATGSAVLVEKGYMQRLMPETQLPEGNDVHCLALGESIIAIKRKAMGSRGLVDLGITTGEAYHDLWESGQVYEP